MDTNTLLTPLGAPMANQRAIELACMFEAVHPETFYRTIFPDGSLDIERELNGWMDREKKAYNGILVGMPWDPAKSGKRVIHRFLTDDMGVLDEIIFNHTITYNKVEYRLRDDLFWITSPITYAGKDRVGRNAHAIYGLAIDVDYVKSHSDANGIAQWITVMNHQWSVPNLFPQPTFIVASGNGVHLYYVFEHPLPCFPNVMKSLANYKRWLTDILWNPYIINVPRKDGQRLIQIGSIWQGFRVPGSLTKAGDETVAFETGPKISIAHLNSFLPSAERKRSTIPDIVLDETIQAKSKSSTKLEIAKNQWPDWYDQRIIKGQPCTNTWTANRHLYDWWLGMIETHATVGHRYFCLLYLVAYALKCRVPYDVVAADAKKLQPIYEAMTPEGSGNHFTDSDVNAALSAYYSQPYLARVRIQTIEDRTGIGMAHNKRNGRKQADHLKLLNEGIMPIRRRLGEIKDGRPSKEDAIIEWRRDHPMGTVAECIRDTGISRATVYRHWKKSI